MKNLTLLIVFFCTFAAACGGDDLKKAPFSPATNNSSQADAGNNESTDGGTSNNAMENPACADGVLNQDESDVDCGGNSCAPCDIGGSCNMDGDCTSAWCEEGTCGDRPLPTGAACTDSAECASGTCKAFGDQSVCTETCTDTCPGQNLACLQNECVPDTYCDDPDGDGFGFGPGCSGQPCDRCADDATCAEQAGGEFTCMCNDGFSGDGETCGDIDECASNPCDPNAACTNSQGSFTCSCPAGFSGDGFTCADIDECAQGTDTCDLNATCLNLAGTYDCRCGTGYTGDGETCTDVDECASGLDNCSANATCTNNAGSFDCACNAGYNGDGVTCTQAAAAPGWGDLTITEIMQNPSAQLDSEAEWFEIWNGSNSTLDLNGCRVLSGSSTFDDEFTISGLPDLAPGGYIVFARDAQFAGVSDFIYNGAINLNNSTDDLRIRCTQANGVELQVDEVSWDDGATFPDPNGASMNLDPASFNVVSNDSGSNWCEATSPYFSTDKGTPGLVNTNCP